MELTFPLAYDFLARPPFFFSSRVSRFSSSRSFDTFSFLLVRILWYRFLLIIKEVSFFFIILIFLCVIMFIRIIRESSPVSRILKIVVQSTLIYR